MNLEAFLKEKSTSRSESKPVIFDLSKPTDQMSLEKLCRENKIQNVADDYEEQLKELFQVNNPALVYTSGFKEEFQKYLKALKTQIPLWMHGCWTYFPWSCTLVHILEDEDFQRVRTARNRNLITEAEQKQFYNATIGIGGLSVGNSVALTITLMGGARKLRLADFDTLSLSNLNRIRGGVEFLGLSKVEMAARQIYSLNPYAEIEFFPQGLNKENLDAFFKGIDVVVDELDTIAVKLLIREYARKYKIAVIMGADNGDNAIIDIERHDLEPNTPFFHDALGQVAYDELTKLDKFGIGRTITKMLGAENIEIRMQQSLLEMGKMIVSWPQLGDAALLNGIAMAYCARKIITKQSLVKDRAILSLDEKLDPSYNFPEEKEKRRLAAESFKKIFGL